MLMIIIMCCNLVKGGQEVVYKYELAVDDIKPSELTIVQYDNRFQSKDIVTESDNYWFSSIKWNKAYTKLHGHKYELLSMKGKCVQYDMVLHDAWCKVKGMLEISKKISDTRAFLFLDSDSIITSNYSMTDIVGFIHRELKWDYHKKPFAMNQDGPGWACKFTMTMKKKFSYCLNSGTVFWINNIKSIEILESWWKSALDPYEQSRFPVKFRIHWPWEQAQMYKVYEEYQDSIMKLSFPDQPFLNWTSFKNPNSQYPTDYVEPWCFSHWPGANCFISHHCASIRQKNKIIEKAAYINNNDTSDIEPIFIESFLS